MLAVDLGGVPAAADETATTFSTDFSEYAHWQQPSDWVTPWRDSNYCVEHGPGRLVHYGHFSATNGRKAIVTSARHMATG